MQIVIPQGPLDLPALEEQVRAAWSQSDTRARFAARNPEGPRWVTVDGPPTVNGKPALHHVWTSIHKDIYSRFRIQTGHRVERRPGWDCQGLPIEIAVERELGLSDKKDIENYGIGRFVAACRALVAGNIDNFQEVLERSAYWMDYEHPYVTMDDDYLESAWSHVKVLWNRGLVYEGYRVVPYCTRCGTALSSHELGQPGVYKDVTDTAISVGLQLHDRPWRLVVWTTTPWTLPANVAVAVDPDMEYGVYAVSDQQLVVATQLAPQLFGDDAEPIERLRGRDLAGFTYRRPFPEVGADAAAHGVVVAADDMVEDEGTGLIHLAPAFGAEDFAVGQQEGLPVVNNVGPDGRYTTGPFEGTRVHEANELVIAELERTGILVRRAPHLHAYPHCWRCGTPLIYWAKPTWFIATSTIKQDMLDQNAEVTWYPANIKEGRFGNWLRENVDWAVSRDRYWGTPLPIWRCDNGHDSCVGSRAELSELRGQDLADLPLHRPVVDEVTFPCPQCGAVARRVAPVCDVWLDSGCAPAAQWSVNAQDGLTALGDRFPADFICEAIDQTRGWFYSLLALNTMVFGQTPYRNVVCLGHLVDDEGRKMSKSLGNVIDPNDLFPTHGADGVRWYMFSLGAPWGSKRISVNAMVQRVRKDLHTLWNTAQFYRQYAELERSIPDLAEPSDHVMDRWIRSRLNHLAAQVTEHLNGFVAHQAAAEISNFIDELSNWYIRRNRRRFWDGANGADFRALATLREVLGTLAVLMSPFTPHFADAIWTVARGAEADSVHLEPWAVPSGPVDEALEADMELARRASSLIRAARAQSSLPVRQPLRRVIATLPADLPPEILKMVLDEVNARELITDPDALPVHRQVRPNWRVLGPRYRHLTSQISTALGALEAADIRRLAGGESLSLSISGHEVTIHPDDVTITEQIDADWVTAQDMGITVALDTTSDAALDAEFRRRTLVRHIQMARRSTGLRLQDRIVLGLPDDVWAERDLVATEVLASEVVPLAGLVAEGRPGLVRGDDFAFELATPSPA